MPVFSLPAHAKLNLGLQVTGRRPDGYHELCTLMVNVDVADEVALEPGDGLEVSGPYADDVGEPGGNLAARALGAVGELAGRPLGLGIRLLKRIPAGAGLGGGSADAAAILRAASVGLHLPAGVLEAAALRLGADVPYQFHGGTALVTGVGDRVRVLPHLDAHVAVAYRTACGTASVFAELGRHEYSDGAATAAAAAALDSGLGDDPGRAMAVLEELPNDIFAAAVRRYPALDHDRAALAGAGWQPRLTGSGGAFYQLAGDAAEAKDLAVAAGRAGFATWACRTIKAPGPATATA